MDDTRVLWNSMGKADVCPTTMYQYLSEPTRDCIEDASPICLDLVKRTPDACQCTRNSGFCVDISTPEKAAGYYQRGGSNVILSESIVLDSVGALNSNSNMKFVLTTDKPISIIDSSLFVYFNTLNELIEIKTPVQTMINENLYEIEWNIIFNDINQYASDEISSIFKISETSAIYNQDSFLPTFLSDFNDPQVEKGFDYDNGCFYPDNTEGYELEYCKDFVGNNIPLSKCGILCKPGADYNDPNIKPSRKCTRQNTEYIFEGCTKTCSKSIYSDDIEGYDLNDCKAPTLYTAVIQGRISYGISYGDDGVTPTTFSEHYCNLKCDTNFGGIPKLECPNHEGVFQFSGCSKRCINGSYSEFPGYNYTECQSEFDCKLSCLEGYEGNPSPMVCGLPGSPWAIDYNDPNARTCVTECKIENIPEGYRLQLAKTAKEYNNALITDLTEASKRSIQPFVECDLGYDSLNKQPVIQCNGPHEEMQWTGCYPMCDVNQIGEKYDLSECPYANQIYIAKQEGCKIKCKEGYASCIDSDCICNTCTDKYIDYNCDKKYDPFVIENECNIICMPPQHQNKYDLTECSSWPSTVDNCVIKCAAGYKSVEGVQISNCLTPYEEFIISNDCQKECTLPSDIEGYTITGCDTPPCVLDDLVISCADGYTTTSNVVGTCIDAEFEFHGCVKKTCLNSPNEITCDDGIQCTKDLCGGNYDQQYFNSETKML